MHLLVISIPSIYYNCYPGKLEGFWFWWWKHELVLTSALTFTKVKAEEKIRAKSSKFSPMVVSPSTFLSLPLSVSLQRFPSYS